MDLNLFHINWARTDEVLVATIKEATGGEPTIILRVENSTYLVLAPDVEQSNGNYYVQVPNSNQYGWINRTHVMRYPGDLGTSEVEEITDPLAELNYTSTSADRVWASYQLELDKPQIVYKRVREGYVLAQDARLKIPIWVQYVRTPENGRISNRVIGNDYVVLPTHFYKIIVDAKNANAIEVLAFMLPNENLTGRNISEFLTSVDEIERLTGLNFLEKLPDHIENEVEALIATQVW